MRSFPWTVVRMLIVCATAGVLSAAALPGRAEEPAPNTLSDQEKAEGWKLLFDGKTTHGWRGWHRKDMPDNWQAIDGALVCVKGSGTDILTTEQYANFELLLDWKISAGGNSGIMFRVTENAGAPFCTGPEYQILDNAGHGDGQDPFTSTGACYAIYKAAKDAAKPAGQWNRTKLVCNGNHVEHWLNGEKIVEYQMNTPEWDALVAKSKFHEWPGFGKNQAGHIDLQDHGARVEFRNLKIRVLP